MMFSQIVAASILSYAWWEPIKRIYRYDTLSVVDGDDKPVIMAFNIEDDPIVSDETGVAIHILDIGWSTPLRTLGVVVPRL